MTLRRFFVFSALLLLSFFVAPTLIPGADGTNWGVSSASAQNFRDPKSRAAAGQTVRAKALPEPGTGRKCGSLESAKTLYFFNCGPKMRPLQRRYCEKQYKKIVEMKKCSSYSRRLFRLVGDAACKANKQDYDNYCGDNLDRSDAEAVKDCEDTLRDLKAPENKCKPSQIPKI